MSDSATNGPSDGTSDSAPSAPQGRGKSSFLSRKLRRASFILPQTGERSKRQFTLREASHRLAGSSSETRPLMNGHHHGNDDDGDDDDAMSNGHSQFATQHPRLVQFYHAGRDRCDDAWQFATSSTGIAIFKCSLAYFLGSLATLTPAFSALFGHRQDAKHMVATVTVWFHPARTIGSMHEATVLAIIALCYGGVVSFTSMGLANFFGQHGLLTVGHAIILVIFVGGGLGLVAWVKQRLAHPLVNVACSLASLGCITILIREGSVQLGQFSAERIVYTLCMVVTGITIVTLVNILVLPILARKRLIADMEKTTDLLGEMLICITRAFLQGRESLIQDAFYQNLSKEHGTSLASMKKNLGEARREHLLLGNERLVAVSTRVVDCLCGLSHDLGGLRSAALAQFAFLNEDSAKVPAAAVSQTTGFAPEQPIQSAATSATQSDAASRRPSYLDSITEAPEDFGGIPRNDSSLTELTQSASDSPMGGSQLVDLSQSDAPLGFLYMKDRQNGATANKAPSNLFLTFISQLGPPTKSLVYTLKQILDDLPFEKKEKHIVNQWLPYVDGDVKVAETSQLHISLVQAIELYRQSRKDALNFLYQNRAINASLNPRTTGERSAFSAGSRTSSTVTSPVRARNPKFPTSRPPASEPAGPSEAVLADVEEVTACCGHFSFSLLDFAEDVLSYLDVLEDLKQEIEAKRRSWKWLMFWRQWRNEPSHRLQAIGGAADDSHEHTSRFDIPLPIRRADDFANPQRYLLRRPWYYGVHKALSVFRRDDTKFAIKVGIGAALYALPAFLEETRPLFVLWRGEWGLVSYMAVCSMTVGASNTTGFKRMIGTCIGACLAMVSWVISSNHGEANPWLLGLIGWLVAVGCFYLIIAKDNGPMGRFILLTYNLGALYSYSLAAHDDDNDDDEGGIDPAIWDIVMHRLVAVVIGTIWGIIICRMIWPSSARRKLRQGLCVLWLRMGLIWKRDPLAMFLLGEPASAYMDIREESELHAFLANLKSLRNAARSEFEFEGPFPDDIVKRMLDGVARMLDAFHAMNVVISGKFKSALDHDSAGASSPCSPGEAAVLRYTRPERFALSARISHLFTVLASSMKLEYPVNDVLPTIDNSRDQLLGKISAYRRACADKSRAGGRPGAAGEHDDDEEQRSTDVFVPTTEQDYELLYAYVLVTGQLAQDIAHMGEEIEKLFGTLNEENLKLQ